MALTLLIVQPLHCKNMRMEITRVTTEIMLQLCLQGRKGQSAGDAIRRPYFQCMQFYSVSMAPALYSLILFMTATIAEAKIQKERMASLKENVGRPYHLFAILNARTFCDYFLQRTGSLITLFFPPYHHHHHHSHPTCTEF